LLHVTDNDEFAKAELNGHGRRIRVCIDKARVARQRADDLESTAWRFEEVQRICEAKRHVLQTLVQAQHRTDLYVGYEFKAGAVAS
jgi:hypothetical protein